MKKFNVRIEGKVFEVEVEEVESSTKSSTPISRSTESQASTQAPVVTPQQKPKTPETQVSSGDRVVSAPMPGTVINILVSEGDTVKAGQPLLILEAMKMENDIVAPRDAKVSSINTSKGAAVNTGDNLITLA